MALWGELRGCCALASQDEADSKEGRIVLEEFIPYFLRILFLYFPDPARLWVPSVLLTVLHPCRIED